MAVVQCNDTSISSPLQLLDQTSHPQGDVGMNIGPFHVVDLNPCIISNGLLEAAKEKEINSQLGSNVALGIINSHTQGEIQTRWGKEKVSKQNKRK